MCWTNLIRLVFLLITAAAFNADYAMAAFPEDMTVRVSVDSQGGQLNLLSEVPYISANGRFVVFYTAAPLIPGDTNGTDDIYVRDLKTGTISRESVSSAGVQANGPSATPVISSDGRYVAFYSQATNLVASDANGTMTDIFVRDRTNGTTELVSKNTHGGQANDYSYHPSISDDGRYVAFDSFASNLEFGDTNGNKDVFLHDRNTGKTVMVSVRSDGSLAAGGDSGGAVISGDGKVVAFSSSADNLVAYDSNVSEDVFVHHVPTGKTIRVSVSSLGVQGNGDSSQPRLSREGNQVVFTSLADNLVTGDSNSSYDVFLHIISRSTTSLVSVDSAGNQGNSVSRTPFISADGRFVSFISLSDNLVAGDINLVADVFIRDLLGETTIRANVATGGGQVNGSTNNSCLSGHGDLLVFDSVATTLVSGDTNGVRDIFLRGIPRFFPWPAFLPSIISSGQP